MTEYIPKYLPIRIKHGALHRRRLKAAKRATVEGARWFRPTLTLPCTQCKGRGAYTKGRDGKRRPFDHRDFKPGERYIATCPKCRGLGRRVCSVDELRKAYKKIRKLVCKERGFDLEIFDRMVKRRLGSDPSPATWYEAAKEVASTYGIESTGL